MRRRNPSFSRGSANSRSAPPTYIQRSARAERRRPAPRLGVDAIEAGLVGRERRGEAAAAGSGVAQLDGARLAARRGQRRVDRGVGAPARTPRRARRRRSTSASPGSGASGSADRHRIGRRRRQPARRLPPEELVACDRRRRPASSSATTPRPRTPSSGPARSAAPRRPEARRRPAPSSRRARSRRAAGRRAARSPPAPAAPPTACASRPACAPMRMIGCVSPSAVTRQLVVRRPIAPVSTRRADQAAAAIVQLHRQHFFERRAGQAALRERPAAEHEQAAAALGDEVGRHRQLRAREEVGFDVRDDERVVGEELLAPRREAAGQRRRAAGARLDEERVLAVVVLALARRPNRPRGPDRPSRRAS